MSQLGFDFAPSQPPPAQPRRSKDDYNASPGFDQSKESDRVPTCPVPGCHRKMPVRCKGPLRCVVHGEPPR